MKTTEKNITTGLGITGLGTMPESITVGEIKQLPSFQDYLKSLKENYKKENGTGLLFETELLRELVNTFDFWGNWIDGDLYNNNTLHSKNCSKMDLELSRSAVIHWFSLDIFSERCKAVVSFKSSLAYSYKVQDLIKEELHTYIQNQFANA